MALVCAYAFWFSKGSCEPCFHMQIFLILGRIMGVGGLLAGRIQVLPFLNSSVPVWVLCFSCLAQDLTRNGHLYSDFDLSKDMIFGL